MLLSVFLRPRTVSVLVHYVDYVPVVRFRPRPCNTCVFGDYVAAENNPQKTLKLLLLLYLPWLPLEDGVGFDLEIQPQSEDTEESSNAGKFLSIAKVLGEENIKKAIDEVIQAMGEDKDNQILSMPPIINGELTKINENVFNIIENQEIWLSNPYRFNDPVDPFIKIYSNMYKYLMDRVKIACLSSSNNNTLMWSHYADKHEGICIGYDINDPNLYKNFTTMFKVIYDMEIINLNNFFSSNFYTPKRLGNIREEYFETCIETLKLFLYKSKEWNYEDEYRILQYDELASSNGMSKKLKIKSVCFGANINKYYKKIIIDIVKNTDIKLYEAKFDYFKPYIMNINEYKC